MEKTQTVLLILAVILAYLVYNQNYITLGIVIAIFIALLSLIYFKQNNLLYMPGKVHSNSSCPWSPEITTIKSICISSSEKSKA